ncbi:MAG: NRDE family protein [Proteobacteria bacterium]|nr:NRDE family protein [Pseudomonadota bacterium]
MCTVVVLRRPGRDWPVLIGANRDEMANRPWKPPARHWDDRPDIVAGLDELAGGTWMGLSDTGVVACILNRHGTLGPAPGKRSRGELVLDALDHPNAADAAEAFADLDPLAYRPFNLVIADNRDAFWLTLRASVQGAWIDIQKIPDGLSMFTAFDRDDPADPRIAHYKPLFTAAQPPDPDTNDWESWRRLLGSTEGGTEARAMSFQMPNGFGTSSSSLLALPSPEQVFRKEGKHPAWLFAAGRPESAPFQPVDMSAGPVRPAV